MPALVGPAIAPVLAGPAEVFVSGGSQLPEPHAPPPVPGDPDVEWEPTPGRFGPRVQVILGEAITRRVFGELITAEVEHYDHELELLAGETAGITARSTDPLWASIGLVSSIGADGRLKYSIDPAELMVWIYEDGACVWTGRFFEPVDIGDGFVMLPAQGPQSVFETRLLGRAEQLDLLGDRGSFERYSSIAEMVADGWRFPDTVTPALVEGGVRGDQCLKLTGPGWVDSPRITLQGSDVLGEAVVGSSFGRWTPQVPEGAPVVATWTQRTDSLAPSNPEVSLESVGRRPEVTSGWTEDPVSSGARMSAQAVPHRNWVSVASFAGADSFYDLTTMRQSVQTGFPPGVKRDLSQYVVRILIDLVARSLGGSPTGITTRIASMTGVETSQRWSHARRIPVTDVLSAVLNAEGGPECEITTDWVLVVNKFLGALRTDIALSSHDVATPGFTIDAGGRIHDFIGDTGRGSGVTWVSATVSTPLRENEWRNAGVVLAPVDRSLNEIGSWTRAHARAAARKQVTMDLDVSREVARQLRKGDAVPVAVHDGDLTEVRWMRTLRIRHRPMAGLAKVSLGATDAT